MYVGVRTDEIATCVSLYHQQRMGRSIAASVDPPCCYLYDVWGVPLHTSDLGNFLGGARAGYCRNGGVVLFLVAGREHFLEHELLGTERARPLGNPHAELQTNV